MSYPADRPAVHAGGLFDYLELSGLAQEVAALRHEIEALRADLMPKPSIILTGREVMDEFRKLKILEGE